MPNVKTMTKTDQVLSLLKRPLGVGLLALMEKTGWQRHTVRGFMSNLRKKGCKIESKKSLTGETFYRARGVTR